MANKYTTPIKLLNNFSAFTSPLAIDCAFTEAMQNRNTIDNQLPRGAIPPQVNSPAHMVTDQVYASTTPDDTTNRYPCCNRPSAGPHSPDCMFNLYNHMIENYQTYVKLLLCKLNRF